MDDKSGQGSPGGLGPQGLPNIQQYGVPTAQEFMPKPHESQHTKDVREIYKDLVQQGMHPVDAAKQAQAQTGMSAVTGEPIRRFPKFSKKSSKIIGQYGTSGKMSFKSKFGTYGA